MKKIDYSKILNSKKFIITAIAIIFILVIILTNLSYRKKKEKQINDNISGISAGMGFESVEAIIKYYGGTYISEKTSKDKNFYKDIYAKLKYDTFDDGKSQEFYYKSMLDSLSSFIQRSYRLIDDEKELTIEAKANIDDNGNMGFLYIINGIDDYFTKQKSKLSYQNRSEEKNTNFNINSNEILTAIQNDWKKGSVSFGTKDSDFDKYEIYFDEGYEVRYISGKIYNINFTKKYGREVVNGIVPGMNFEEIIKTLGTPTYGMDEEGLIGYKNDKMYVFFTEDKIHIFRNEKTNLKDFEELLGKYIEKEIDIKEFMNKLTYMWDDYAEYDYTESSIYLSYPIKGIIIDMDRDSSLGIQIYSNCNLTEKLIDYIENDKITAKMEENALQVQTKKELDTMNNYKYIGMLSATRDETFEGENEEENRSELYSGLFLFYAERSEELTRKNIKLISQVEDYPNRELNEVINEAMFASDNMLIYSIQNKGIYVMNVTTGEIFTIVEGKDRFEIKSFENNVLQYDNNQIRLNME